MSGSHSVLLARLRSPKAAEFGDPRSAYPPVRIERANAVLSGDMENCTGGDIEKCTTF